MEVSTEDKPIHSRPQSDSVERAMQIIGDTWTFLILRELFFGERRFDRMQKQLGVAPNILTGRLKRLVEAGVLAREPYCDRPPRFEYRLTEKGIDLYPAIVLIMRWGDKWLDGGKGPPLELVHRSCGQITEPVCICNRCGQPIGAREIAWQPGPGAK